MMTHSAVWGVGGDLLLPHAHNLHYIVLHISEEPVGNKATYQRRSHMLEQASLISIEAACYMCEQAGLVSNICHQV